MLLPYSGKGCFRYHKGTDFQANHNSVSKMLVRMLVVLDTTKVLIFKQITTVCCVKCSVFRCFRYHKGTDFQANHNTFPSADFDALGCFRYHKGTDFQANHNALSPLLICVLVVLDTTKVLIFKQITTKLLRKPLVLKLF